MQLGKAIRIRKHVDRNDLPAADSQGQYGERCAVA
jgi:hypothetical protein